MADTPVQNTDREIWREIHGDYYSDSVHVTANGGIGINHNGLVRVWPPNGWHMICEELASLREQLAAAKRNNICDVCAGKNTTDTPCICGDTGLACDAVVGYQKELLQARRERDQARASLDALSAATGSA